MLAFTIDGNGNLVQASIQTSSGHSLLDDATLDMVRRAAPFPPFPTELGRSTLALVVPIQFNLRWVFDKARHRDTVFRANTRLPAPIG